MEGRQVTLGSVSAPSFETSIAGSGHGPLLRGRTTTLQVNVGKRVLVPWATQRLSVLDTDAGAELVRWHMNDTVLGHALVDRGHVYVGQHGLLRLDSRLLQPGMAMTVEPGIYVRPAEGVPEKYWNIGIRIEDDVIVRDGGYQLLTGSAPKTVAEIEALMK